MTANELWGNTEIICEHTFLITLKIHILLCFQIFPLRKTLFLIRAIFIQGAFKNIQGLLGKIQGLFKDIPQISNFQGLFKDIMIFQGLFKARANHVNELLSFYKLACRRNRHSIFLRKKIRATKLSQQRL